MRVSRDHLTPAESHVFYLVIGNLRNTEDVRRSIYEFRYKLRPFLRPLLRTMLRMPGAKPQHQLTAQQRRFVRRIRRQRKNNAIIERLLQH